MTRLATYVWSLSLGLVGFFLGLGLLGSFHTFERWQVGLAGFITALALAIPTAIGVSRLSAAITRFANALLACAGLGMLMAMMFLYSRAVFH